MKEEQETITQYLKYTVNKDSDEGILLEYLKLERYEPLSRLILQAVMSYWLPLALEKQEDCDQNKLKKWAEQSIYVLRRQADYFACKFGINLDDLPENYYQKASFARQGRYKTVKRRRGK